jgi:hypothetical protein
VALRVCPPATPCILESMLTPPPTAAKVNRSANHEARQPFSKPSNCAQVRPLNPYLSSVSTQRTTQSKRLRSPFAARTEWQLVPRRYSDWPCCSISRASVLFLPRLHRPHVQPLAAETPRRRKHICYGKGLAHGPKPSQAIDLFSVLFMEAIETNYAEGTSPSPPSYPHAPLHRARTRIHVFPTIL